jgi:hypothetical protein
VSKNPVSLRTGHLLDVAGVAQGLFLHVGHLERSGHGPQSVRIEGFEGTNPGESQKLGVRERRPGDQLSVFDVAGRPDILLDDVVRRKNGLVLVGVFTDLGQAADVDVDALRFVELLHGVRGQNTAHARSDAAIYNGRHSFGFGQLIQGERVLGKKGDVDGGLSAFEDGSKRLETHEPRHGADDHVRIPDDLFYICGIGQVFPGRLDPAESPESVEGLRRDVHSRYGRPLVRGQVPGHRTSDQAGSQYGDFHDVLLF